jgi:benzoyl-CoA reductase/2-hydroxyglutaryl-CoA dehydratase subunit BcrC/BadD/HgdB
VKPLQTNVRSKALQALSEAAQTIVNPEVQKWKDQGGKILGYFCAAMPVEMITAAGFLPFRVRATGSTGTELSDAYFGNINCTFPRHAFNMALRGEYDFLDGVVIFNSCDHIRRLYDHWIRQMKTQFVKILSLPRKDEPAQVEWFRGELAILREHMQEHFRVEITDDKLREAIALHNTSRRRQRELYELRKTDRPPITGTEMLAVTVAGTAMPPSRYNHLLGELLKDVGKDSGHSGYRARLMIVGGELDNPEYIRVIEDQGGLVVTDALCFGSRMIWRDVDQSISDPLTALAQYYVADRPPCARMYTKYDQRVEYIKNMIRDFNVNGVIFVRLTFCELWGFEQYSLTNDFKQLNIPLLCMDREYTLSGVGQLRTRVQAFLETLGDKHG